MPPTFTDEGLRAAVEPARGMPRTAVLVLSQYVEERFATELLGGDGGVGYLLKERVADVAEFIERLPARRRRRHRARPEVVAQLLARRPSSTRSPR